MRQLLTTILALTLFLPMYGDDYEHLTFVRNDGTKVSITAVGTVITFTDDLLTAVNGEESRQLSLDDLSKMYFASSGQFLLGDVNDDGVISVVDVMLIVDHILGHPLDDTLFERADVDGDSIISVTDVTALVSLILNN
jgi:hypothetical protein